MASSQENENDGSEGHPEINRNNCDPERMKLVELKEELKSRKLKTIGNKADLIERLKAALLLEDAQTDKSEHESEHESDYYEEEAGHRAAYVPTFKDVEESMEKFSGDGKRSLRTWLKDFEDTAKLCKWTDIQKLIYARRLLCGSAKLYVNYERCTRTWDELKQSLRAEFSKAVNSHTVHKQLAQRKKREDESYHEYMYSMLDIAAQVSMEAVAVMQYVIDGIRDDELSKTMLYGAKNIKEFKDRLTQYGKMRERQAANPRTKKETERDETRINKQPVRSGSSTHPTKTVRCYYCGDKRHKSDECPTKDRGMKCFKCEDYGHVAAKCPKSTGAARTNAVTSKRRQACKSVTIGTQQINALIDSGSDLSLMRAATYIGIGAPSLSSDKIEFRGVGSNENVTLGSCSIKVKIDEDEYNVFFHVVSDTLIPHDIIIGYDFLESVDVCMRSGDVYISKIPNVIDDIPEVLNIVAANDIDLSHIPDREIQLEVKRKIENYKPEQTKKVGVKMHIALHDETPIYQTARRLSVKENKDLDSQIETWLRDGIVRPSYSDFASPVVLVKKKDGSTRICVDYRRLNQKIIKDRFPLPNIEDQIDRLRDKRVFTTLDLENGFFHVPVDEGSRRYTSFVVPSGQYEFCCVPFGLCNSPSVFQRYINAIFRDLVTSGDVIIYLDDIIVPALDYRDGLDRLNKVLATASEYGLVIKWSKCQFLQTCVEYLGHIIENNSVKPSKQKTNAVRQFAEPTTVRALQSFLGLTGYFRKFVPAYSVIARPLTNMLRGGVNFHFGEKERASFKELKLILTNNPVLRIYSPTAETELHTDASALGFGAILLQRDNEDRLLHPIHYASGKTNPCEEKYHSYELEVLAVVKSLKKFRVYLIGIPFKVITDCQAFVMTLKKKDICPRVARWALFLQDFDYTVQHRSSKAMRHVDALSRYPLPVSMSIVEEEASVIHKIRKAQADDKELQERISRVNDAEKYVRENGLLYRLVDNEQLLVVPKAMQAYVIRLVHERGHFAVAKTEQLLKRDYWFDSMRPKIEKVIQSCLQCVLAERKTGRLEGYLHPIDKGDRPLETYHIDHLGPLASTKKNYRHILVVVDSFTKFVWLYPTKSTTSVEVIDRLSKQALVFGNPRKIISDRGTAFSSHEFADYCKKEDVQHIMITTGIPRANGQVERVNRTLIPLLTKLAHPQAETWHKYVGRAQQYLNHVPSRSTGVSPFQLLIGTRMRLQDDPQVKEILEREAIFVFQEARDESRIQAKEAIARIQDENRKAYNKRRKKDYIGFKEGDLVAIRRTQLGPGLKLCPKYLGPYQIIKVLRNDRYLVEKVGEHEGPRTTSTSRDSMKPWICEDHDLSSHSD